MYITCLDMEGVLVPEIWIEFARESGIPELTRTTRDEPDYDKLMKWRMGVLREHGLGLKEIQDTEAALGEILEGSGYWLRPPYGLIDEAEKKLIKTPMIYWSVDPEDWKVLNADTVTERVCTHVQNGDIILLHDFYPTSVEAALRIVDRLQEEGYEFVTVKELFALNGTKPEPGKLYCNAWELR